MPGIMPCLDTASTVDKRPPLGYRGVAMTSLPRALAALAVFCALFAPSSPVQAQARADARLALVIGNGSYKQSPLANAVADARLMETVLRESGFEVLRAENATLREMRRLVRDFGDRLKETKGVGLFYFAGHGVQLRGENYLISVDSDIRNEDEVPDDSINAQLIVEKMESAGNRINIIVLDACRNNPFASRTRGVSGGLAAMNAPAGTLVAYATAPGSVAFDGSGRNGLYTRHLAQAIRQPGLRVEEVFKRVRTAVRRDSNNEQTPWENTALEGDFFFRGGPAPAVAVAPGTAATPSSPAFELAFWDSIKDSQRKAELEEYLKQFPQGRFAGLARARLAALPAAPAPATTAPAAAPARRADTQVAAARPTAESPGRAVAGTFVALGDRLLFKDSDPFSGVDAREFTRTVTALDDETFALDGTVLRPGPAARAAGQRNSHAEIVAGRVQVAGAWPAEFLPAGGQHETVPLKLQFERFETRQVGGRELRLARATVIGYASRRDGIPGIPTSFGDQLRGHVMIEPERAVVLEAHIRSDNPFYVLRRELIGIEPARR